MSYHGSCHCGNVSFDVEGTFEKGMECNCSHCSRKGYLLWFVPRSSLSISDTQHPLVTYTFNKHVIKHQFCPKCGCAPFGFGNHGGTEMAAVNIRCLENIDLTKVEREYVDGKSF